MTDRRHVTNQFTYRWTYSPIFTTEKMQIPCRRDYPNYASVIGVLMYLSSNVHPEIQFAIHQCACFSTHCPQESHKEAVNHMCWYLQGVKDNGLTFKPSGHLQLDCYVDAYFARLWNYKSNQDPVCIKQVSNRI